MALVDRARDIVLHPGETWPVVAAEPSSNRSLVTGYVAPLAAIAPVATFIGLTLVGVSVPFLGTYRLPFTTGLTQAILSFCFALAGVFLVAWIVNVLAPTFDGRKDFGQALKVTAYSYTPAFLAGALLVFPPLALLQIFAAFYGLYLLYTGLPIVMGSAREKTPGYALSIVAVAIVVGVAFGAATAAMRFSSYGLGSHALGAATGDETGKAIAAQIVGNVLGGGDEKSAKAATDVVNSIASASAQAERAAASGDANAEALAGANVLGALVTGGKHVTVVPRESLKAMLPDSTLGMSRAEARSETGSFASIKGSKASALYQNAAGGRVTLEISDMGNMGGLAAIATIASSLVENEDDAGFEKNVQLDGRKVHESWRNANQHAELFTIVDDRFYVGATSEGLPLETALQAFQAIDAGKLESLAAAK